MPNATNIPFQRVLDALLDSESTFPPRYLYQFSDLEPKEVAELAKIWDQVPGWRRLALMEDIEELGLNDLLLSFEALGRFALKDSDGKIRLLALRILGEYESADLATTYLQMLESDSEMEVRAAAATALGRFVYDGETEAIPEKLYQRILDRLLSVVNGADAELVRRMALESLGFSCHEQVPSLIDTAFHSDSIDWVASALFAMGRSANEHWAPQVLSMLESKMPAVRQEAARAAGELEIRQALSRLYELLDDPDEETRLASIWSLSQIGGNGVREALELLYSESEDDDEQAYLEKALDNLEYTEEIRLMPFFELPEQDLEEDYDENDGLDWFTGDGIEEEDDDEEDPVD